MKLLIPVTGLLLAALSAQPARAQLSPTAIAQGQVLAGTARGYAERDRKAQLAGKRPARRPLTPAQQREAHRREVEADMRRPPAAPGTIR